MLIELSLYIGILFLIMGYVIQWYPSIPSAKKKKNYADDYVIIIIIIIMLQIHERKVSG